MRKAETTNSFEKGLISDFNPISTPNNTYTNALNATLLTMNGNENVIQCDMGNGRVETAYLPQGYIPLGTAQLGGIIYIASYNPLTNKSQIGSFPSPERNITTDDSTGSNISLGMSQFTDGTIGGKYFKVKFPTKLIELSNTVLNPGDKFQIGINRTDLLSAVGSTRYNPDDLPNQLKLNVVAVQDDGTINNLNHSLTWNDGYYMMPIGELDKLSDYRDLIHSNYSIFNSKVSGKLAILAQLEAINSFDVSWDANKEADGWKFSFSLNWTYENSTSPSGRNITGIIVDYNGVQEFISIDEFVSADKLKARKNDGTDDDIIVTGEHYVNSAGSKTITVYPVMDFGALDYLKQSFTIDIDKLGTGQIDLKEYRYFYNTKKIVLNWGLEAYPEKNKKIESVIFDFQKYKGGITNAIDTTKWEIVDGKATSNDQPDFTSEHYIEVKKTSFSGNFTTDITQLEDDKLYVVRITIKYTGKDIVYYRLMYTCSIFNKYYFKKNDFAEIILGDEIPEIISYTTQNEVSTVENSYKLLDSSNNEIEEIPKYLLEDQNSRIKEYTVENTYNRQIISQVVPISKYNVFTPKVTLSSSNASIDELQHDGSILHIDRNNQTYKLEEIPKIEEKKKECKIDSIQEDRINLTLKNTINTPITVCYSISQEEVKYQLEGLTINSTWMIVTGYERHINIAISDTYEENPSTGKHDFGDDDEGQPVHSLAWYSELCSEISNRLKNCDVLILYFTSWNGGYQGNEGVRTGYNRGTINSIGSNNPMASYVRYYRINGNGNNEAVKNCTTKLNYFLPIYAVKNSNNGISLITFADSMGDSEKSGSKFNTLLGTTIYRGGSYASYKITGRQPFALAGTTITSTEEILKKPFEGYQVVSEYNNTKPINTWQTIYYFDDYKYTDNIKITTDRTLTLEVNDIEISGDNLPKNLQYTSKGEQDIIVTISDIARVYNYINKFLSHSTSKSLTLVKDDIKELDISKNLIYDQAGNTVSYLKTIDNTPDSTHKMQYYDNSLRLVMGKVQSASNYTIAGAAEEQSIFITEVYMV